MATPPSLTLGTLVLGGENQTSVIAVTDTIFLSQDVSNVYLVTSPAGDVLINTGTVAGARRHQDFFRPVRQGPLTHIILTQGHPDHFGGLSALKETGTVVVAQRNLARVRGYMNALKPFYGRRTQKLWGPILGEGHGLANPEDPKPNQVVDHHLAFTVGTRQFELLATPGGETLDSLVVWLPQERTVFTGNLLGPVYLHMPNLYTLRGDKIRSVVQFLEDVEKVRSLEPELLITGHGEPVRGAARIQEDLIRLRDGVRHVYDATIAGMNAGIDLFTLMNDITLPPELALGEGHGKVSWAVRAIWEEHAGWFRFESTTEIYGVPPRAVAGDILDLAGGPDSLAARAQHLVDRGQALKALHLVDISLAAQPDHRASLRAKQGALAALLAACEGNNLSETMWLKAELAATQERWESQ